MESIKRRTKTARVSFKNIQTVNTVSGELNEFADFIMLRQEATNEVEYQYSSFVVLNTFRLMSLLKDGIKQCDLALITSISLNMRYGYNICMKDSETPHDAKSIAELIDEKEQSVRRKLKRLIKLGVIAHQKMPWLHNLGKVYIVNPLYIKIGKHHSDALPGIFSQIRF
jgi:hypothetical protein